MISVEISKLKEQQLMIMICKEKKAGRISSKLRKKQYNEEKNTTNKRRIFNRVVEDRSVTGIQKRLQCKMTDNKLPSSS